MTKKYNHIIFDLDKTLWDFESNTEKTLQILFSQFHFEKFFESFDEFSSIYHSHNNFLWEEYRKGRIQKDYLRWARFHKTLSAKNIENEKLAREIGEIYVEISPRQNILLPGSIDLLKYLFEKKYTLHILTNGFKEVQYIKLNSAGINNYFDQVFISEEIGFMKPNPQAFKICIEKLKTTAKECIMIGDDAEVDIIGAAVSGMDQIWFNWEDKKHDFTPTYEVKTLNEIKAIL